MPRLAPLLLALCALPCFSAAGREVPASKLVDLAAAALLQALPGTAAAVSLQPLGAVASLPVPDGVIDISAHAPRRPNPLRPLRVWLDVRVDGKPYRRLPVVFVLGDAARPRLAATAAPLPATPVVARVAAAAPALAAPRASAAPSLAVLRGQTVAVDLHDNGILIETKGLALADGRIGEQVPVRTAASQQLYSATVRAERHVTIVAR